MPIAGGVGARRRPPERAAVPDDPALPQARLCDARHAAAGARAMAMILDLIVQGAQMALVLLLAPLLTGFVRKVKARLLRRRGPAGVAALSRPRRLLNKEAVIAHNASWLFRVAPYLIFAATWVAAALVPTFAMGLYFSWSADLIAITALIGSARFFLALAGMDVGTSFGGIGSSREVMIASLAEPAMIMITFTVALIAGSTQLSNIAAFMLSPAAGLSVSLGLALIALIIVAIAENARVPVDNPATHLELTMVHEAMVLEYSGRHLAMIELAAALKLLLYVSLIACIFVPWGLAGAKAGPPALRDRRRSPISRSSPLGAAARRVRDSDRQDARLPRAGVPWRRLHARASRQSSSLRGAEPMIAQLLLRCRASPRRRTGAGQPDHALSAPALRAAQRLCAARLRARAARSPGRPTSRTRRISTSPPLSPSSSRRSSSRSRCTA